MGKTKVVWRLSPVYYSPVKYKTKILYEGNDESLLLKYQRTVISVEGNNKKDVSRLASDVRAALEASELFGE